jgi:WhiB family redox-sensing transcriptional regulator
VKHVQYFDQPDSRDLVDLMRGRPDWHEDAACRTAPLDVSWFPNAGEDAVEAVRICDACPVNEQCLAWSMAQEPTLEGIWAGLTKKDRARLRRQVA